MSKKVPGSSQQSPEDVVKIPLEEIIPLPEYRMEIDSDDSGIELPKFDYVDHDVTFAYDLARLAKVRIILLFFSCFCVEIFEI